MKISFHGADRMVTGSCHLVECGGTRILIDCGMYQGNRELEEDNGGDFGFDPRAIDYLLLTHGHLDHCGRIPLLVKRGFTGTIVTTAATRELARLVMLDAARIQEEDAHYKSMKKGKNHEVPVEPLYDTFDVLDSLDFFVDITSFHRQHDLGNNIRATFFDAGHILGAACILLECRENGHKRRLLFSGDLGYSHRVIIRDPATPPQADVVVMETTYGNRRHKQLQPSIEELYQAINTTLDRGGNVLIPSFALERSQELLYYLREGVESGAVPASLRVFLDSPMAISATRIFQRHPECFDAETKAIFRSGRDPFELPGLRFTRQTQESINLKKIRGGAVIIAGSGMCTGGRIRHHLRHNLWRRKAAVIFVGYAAIGTLARQIIDGARNVKILGDRISVHAAIYTIGGFSAHGDQDDLLQWHRRTGSPEITFLVHGEETSMTAFGQLLQDTQVEMPTYHQEFIL